MRKAYLDNIRWITVILVVIYHVIYMYNGVQPFGVIGPFKSVQYQDAYQYMVYPWFMALLFVVSGISSRLYLESHTGKAFFKSRTTKLLVPSTIGVLAFHWILGYYNMRIGDAFASMPVDAMPKPALWIIMSISGIGVLWYIQVLWVFSVVLIIVRKIEKDRLYNKCKNVGIGILLVLTAFVWGFAQILNTPVITVYRFGIYGLCFFIGYFVLSHDEVIDRLTRYWVPLVVAAVALGTAYTVIYFGENYAVEPTLNCPLACVFAWIMILAVISFMKKWGDRANYFTKWMGRKSWGLYIFHYLPIAITAYYLNIWEVKLPIIAYYVAALAMAFVGGYALNEVVSRVPILRWCVLGIKKEKKDVS